jgi:hypothetical protein
MEKGLARDPFLLNDFNRALFFSSLKYCDEQEIFSLHVFIKRVVCTLANQRLFLNSKHFFCSSI